MTRKILFTNHKKAQCGVYEFGRNIGQALGTSTYTFHYFECGSEDELKAGVREYAPDLIIYNYHPATMGWLNVGITKKVTCPQAGILHEVTQTVADRADNALFNFHIAHDPTLLLKNPIVYKAGRLIPQYENKFPDPEIPVIGSFGFAGKKGHRRLVELVQVEFDEAVIRINIPSATFGDVTGEQALAIADDCRAVLTKPKITLEITHHFFEQHELLDFIAQNTINLFLYEPMNDAHRGISGVVDLALAVGRPLGITTQQMFRHITRAHPSICIENSSIKEIIRNGTRPLEPFCREWTEENLRWDYERITDNILALGHIPKVTDPHSFTARAKTHLKRKLRRPVDEGRVIWIGDQTVDFAPLPRLDPSVYRPAELPENWSLNNILDDRARDVYRGAIDQLFDYLPALMGRKISEANVQQAFVLDTVYKQIVKKSYKTLCVGSFEDSASEALKLLSFDVDEIDPMINYDLSTFLTKPTTLPDSYDVIFSTSVIEHVEDDEKFVRAIAFLLKKGGWAILTCDYNDGYKTGDPKPIVDYRLYTKKDIRERLMSRIPDCRLVDEPQWDCPSPDFWYEGVNYTFASIVFEKMA